MRRSPAIGRASSIPANPVTRSQGDIVIEVVDAYPRRERGGLLCMDFACITARVAAATLGRVRPSLPTPDAGELHHSTSVRREQGNVHQATPGPDPSGTRHDDAGACATRRRTHDRDRSAEAAEHHRLIGRMSYGSRSPCRACLTNSDLVTDPSPPADRPRVWTVAVSAGHGPGLVKDREWRG